MKRAYNQTARAEAAEATAQRIINAFLDRLMQQWFDEITLDKVAADAGVTVQTVVRRFGSKEGLLAEAARTMGEKINAVRQTPAGDIRRMIDALIADYEETGDAVIRLLALEPRHPALQTLLNYGREQHRSWVAGVCGNELSQLDGTAQKRALDALVAVTDVYTWKLLRRDMGRGVPATKATMKSLMRSAISGLANFEMEGNG